MTIAGLYPIVYMLFLGQNSPVVVFAAGLCWFLIRSDRDLLAGLALGLGLTKPNLIILVPVAMLIGGRWRVTLGFTAAAVMIAIHGLLTLGWENSQLFLNLIFRESTTEVAYTMQFLVPNQALLTGLRGLAIATVIVAAKRLGTRHPAELLVVGIIGSAVIATFWHLPDFAIVDLGIVLLLAERWNRTIWVFALISVELSSPLTSGLVVIPAAVQVAGWVLLEWSLLAVLTLTQPKLNSVPPHFTQA
jgi:hypothetical protein